MGRHGHDDSTASPSKGLPLLWILGAIAWKRNFFRLAILLIALKASLDKPVSCNTKISSSFFSKKTKTVATLLLSVCTFILAILISWLLLLVAPPLQRLPQVWRLKGICNCFDALCDACLCWSSLGPVSNRLMSFEKCLKVRLLSGSFASTRKPKR